MGLKCNAAEINQGFRQAALGLMHLILNGVEPEENKIIVQDIALLSDSFTKSTLLNECIDTAVLSSTKADSLSSFIRISSGDLESLLVDYLGEVLYLVQAEGIIFMDFNVEIKELEKGVFNLLSECSSENYSPKLHGYLTEVKAVTYHELSVEKDSQGNWEIQVIFDI